VSAQKLLIIVLVVLVVIFVLIVGIGSCQGSGNTDRYPRGAGAVGALKGLQGNRFLKIGDKATTTCDQVNEFTLRVINQCEVVFEKRRFFNRSTRVVFVPTGAVEVTIHPKNGKERTDPVDSGDCFGSAVDHGGGTMRLSGTATLTLRRKGCPEPE
jgi:hypothetical protein